MDNSIINSNINLQQEEQQENEVEQQVLLFIENCNAKGPGCCGRICRIIYFISYSLTDNDIENISDIFITFTKAKKYNLLFENLLDINNINKTLTMDEENWRIGSENIFIKNIIKDKNFSKLSKIAKLIKFKEEFNVYENKLYDLSIHLRLTDMNAGHGHIYGIVNYPDYIEAINKFLKNNNIRNIFIASDNLKSMNNMIKFIKDIDNNYNIITNNCKYISQQENDTSRWTNGNHFPEVYVIEVMNDVFNLSRSKKFIYRTSSVAILSLLLSKNLTSDDLIYLD